MTPSLIRMGRQQVRAWEKSMQFNRLTKRVYGKPLGMTHAASAVQRRAEGISPLTTMLSCSVWCANRGVAVLMSAILLAGAQRAYAGEAVVNLAGILSADIVEEVSGREIREHRSHVWIAKAGLVVETKGIPGKSPRIVYVYNFDEDKSWIVSPEGKRYCELSNDSDEAEIVGGILSTMPCLGLESEQLEETQWNDQVVSVWQCRKQQRELGKHYYSPSYGVVVKEEGADGIVRELKQLDRLEPEQMQEAVEGISGDFTPVKDYRAVTVNEFFFAKRPLEKYLE